MPHATNCPLIELTSFVNGGLDPAQRKELVGHIDHCPACQGRIEELAAPHDDWELIAEALQDGLASAVSDAQTSSLEGDTKRNTHGWSAEIDGLLRLLSPSDDPHSAGRIGPFEILGIVGSGGMGVVLKARDPALDRLVAIKMLAPHLASSKSARKRFAREARAAAAVIHDNVIPIYQVSHWNDLPYLVMPYLPGPSLEQRIESSGALELEAALSIGFQIAKGLSAAHAQGLVHRDVKPANVLLCKGTERAIITDFGLARATDDASLTRAGMLAGTPHYMSPEQARGEIVDHKSDLFSLGSVLFAMSSGAPPSNRELGSETIEFIAQGSMPILHDVQLGIPDWFGRLGLARQ